MQTIPRLELCGALVLAQLMDKTVKSLELKIKFVYCWTDSTTVLHWLNADPARLVPFVRNRVLDTLKLTKVEYWSYVPSNPWNNDTRYLLIVIDSK